MLTFPLAEFSAAQHCFPGASSESTGPFLSSSHCWPCSCQHFLLTPPGHLPGEWSEQKNPGMEAKRIWPFQCVHQANGQLVTIMGIHSRVSQWNQRPSFALKMGNIFIQHKPTESDLVCCIYFHGELSKTAIICLPCVCTKQEGVPVYSCCNTANDRLKGKQSCLRHQRASIDLWEISKWENIGFCWKS